MTSQRREQTLLASLLFPFGSNSWVKNYWAFRFICLTHAVAFISLWSSGRSAMCQGCGDDLRLFCFVIKLTNQNLRVGTFQPIQSLIECVWRLHLASYYFICSLSPLTIMMLSIETKKHSRLWRFIKGIPLRVLQHCWVWCFDICCC